MGDAADFFESPCRSLELYGTFGWGEFELFDQQRQIDAVFSRRFRAAAWRGIQQVLLRSRELLWCQAAQSVDILSARR